MSVTLYQTILTKADAGFISFIGSTSASVAGSIKPVATTLLMIYVMLWGWSASLPMALPALAAATVGTTTL